MVEKNLVLTSLKQNFSKKKNNVLLGNWCNDFSKTFDKKKILYNHHWSDITKRINDAKKIKKLNEKILIFFSQNLNLIHKTNHSKRYWRILLGPFLYEHIPIIFDRWEILQTFFLKKNFHKINLKTFKNTDLKTYYNSIDSLKALWFDDETNQIIFNRILNENFHHLIKYENFDLDKKKEVIFEEKKTWKRYILEFFGTILFKINFYKFFLRLNNFIFDAKIISFFKFFQLNLKLKNISLDFFFFFFILEKKMRNKKKKITNNIKMREDLRLNINKFTQDKFEIFLINLLIDIFPEIYLERYKNSLDDIKEYLIKKPKIIFSKYHIFHNDIFKLWAAEMVAEGSILIVADHGGYIPLFIDHNLDHESKVSNYHIIANDFKLNSNIIKLPTTIKVYGKKKYKFKNQKNLTFIHRECGLYNFKVSSNMTVPNAFVEFEYLIGTIEKLENKIKQNIKYKCINKTKSYFNNNFSKKYGPSTIINSHEKYEKTLDNAKILVHLYLSTPFYESLHFNTPSLILIPKKLWIFDDNFKKYLNELEKKKILFYDPAELSEHVNNIWNNVNEWWFNKDRQNTIKMFLAASNYKNENPVQDYYKFLKKILPTNF